MSGLVPSLVRGINLGMHFYSHPVFACAGIESSGKTVSYFKHLRLIDNMISIQNHMSLPV